MKSFPPPRWRTSGSPRGKWSWKSALTSNGARARPSGKSWKPSGRDALPVFLGDDLTDEDGFQVVQDADGIAVFVGPARQPTRAAYRVDSPREVTETLRLLPKE